MKYLDKLQKEDKQILYEYTKACFNGNIPDFLEKYLTLPMFQTLKGKGQFCGVENTNLFHPKSKYNRLDHSVNCAGIIWHLTKDKKRTIKALCHDLSTVSFAHTIDFLLRDSINQNAAESLIDRRKILNSSKEFLSYLKEDGLTLEDIYFLEQDSLIDISRPGLCVDRFEGIIHINYIWLNTCSLEDIKTILNDLRVLINEQGQEEIGFKTLEVGQLFFELMLNYAYCMQSKEDKYSMQFIADLLSIAIKDGLLTLSDLYTLKEDKIVSILQNNYEVWQTFEKIDYVKSSNICPSGYYVVVDAKKRYAIPLVQIGTKTRRITDVAVLCSDKLEQFWKFKEQKYLFHDKIRMLVREDLC